MPNGPTNNSCHPPWYVANRGVTIKLRFDGRAGAILSMSQRTPSLCCHAVENRRPRACMFTLCRRMVRFRVMALATSLIKVSRGIDIAKRMPWRHQCCTESDNSRSCDVVCRSDSVKMGQP